MRSKQSAPRVAAARKHGTLADLALDRISSDEEAEAVQAAGVEAYGGAPLGYSIQATSALARRLFGCEARFLACWLIQTSSMTGQSFRCRTAFSAPAVPSRSSSGVLIPARTRKSPARRPQRHLELPSHDRGSRATRAGFQRPDRRTATADFALNVLFVEGSTIGRWAELDLAATQVSAQIDGQVAAKGCGADVMQHPLDALAWLARALAARDREIEAGELVATGTCLGVLQVLPGQSFEADFGEFGRVGVEFT